MRGSAGVYVYAQSWLPIQSGLGSLEGEDAAETMMLFKVDK